MNLKLRKIEKLNNNKKKTMSQTVLSQLTKGQLKDSRKLILIYFLKLR